MATILRHTGLSKTLNESPSEKEGKFLAVIANAANTRTLNESPSEKEGKLRRRG